MHMHGCSPPRGVRHVQFYSPDVPLHAPTPSIVYHGCYTLGGTRPCLRIHAWSPRITALHVHEC